MYLIPSWGENSDSYTQELLIIEHEDQLLRLQGPVYCPYSEPEESFQYHLIQIKFHFIIVIIGVGWSAQQIPTAVNFGFLGR
jgi:hypothetical protein